MPSYSQMRKHVYRVSYDQGEGKRDWGTCFALVAEDGPRFVTAAHVFRKLGNPHQTDLSFCSPSLETRLQLSSIRYLDCDLAIILPCWLDPSDCLPIRLVPKGNMFSAVGYARTSDGMPECGTQSEMKGVIDSNIQYQSCPAFRLNAKHDAVGQGMSGAPVFEINNDMQGEEVLAFLIGSTNNPAYSHDLVAVGIAAALK